MFTYPVYAIDLPEVTFDCFGDHWFIDTVKTRWRSRNQSSASATKIDHRILAIDNEIQQSLRDLEQQRAEHQKAARDIQCSSADNQQTTVRKPTDGKYFHRGSHSSSYVVIESQAPGSTSPATNLVEGYKANSNSPLTHHFVPNKKPKQDVPRNNPVNINNTHRKLTIATPYVPSKSELEKCEVIIEQERQMCRRNIAMQEAEYRKLQTQQVLQHQKEIKALQSACAANLGAMIATMHSPEIVELTPD